MDVSDIFNFFLLGEGGGGEGESEAPGGEGVCFLLKCQEGGGSPGGGGAEGPGGCLRRIGELGWGGAKFFFCGAEMSTKKEHRDQGLYLALRFRAPVSEIQIPRKPGSVREPRKLLKWPRVADPKGQDSWKMSHTKM